MTLGAECSVSRLFNSFTQQTSLYPFEVPNVPGVVRRAAQIILIMSYLIILIDCSYTFFCLMINNTQIYPVCHTSSMPHCGSDKALAASLLEKGILHIENPSGSRKILSSEAVGKFSFAASKSFTTFHLMGHNGTVTSGFQSFLGRWQTVLPLLKLPIAYNHGQYHWF